VEIQWQRIQQRPDKWGQDKDPEGREDLIHPAQQDLQQQQHEHQQQQQQQQEEEEALSHHLRVAQSTVRR